MKKFNFRHFINSLFAYTLFVILVLVVLTVLGNTALGTLFAAIFGEEKAIPATVLFMRIAWYMIVFLIIFLRKRKNDDKRKEYLSEITPETPYSLKTDAVAILKDGDYRAECLAMSIVALLSLLIFKILLFLLIIPAFIIINFLMEWYLHHSWIKNKS